MSLKNENIKGSSRKQTNGYLSSRNHAKQASPYSSRGTSPAASLRKSRSADEKFGFNEKPPDSRGSQSVTSDYSEHNGFRKVAQNTSVPLIEDSISVCVRVRPLSKKELKAGDDSIVQFPGNGRILLEERKSREPCKRVESESTDNLAHSKKPRQGKLCPGVDEPDNLCTCTDNGMIKNISYPKHCEMKSITNLGGQTTPNQKAKIFTYNVVFEPQATQEDVLQHSGIKRLIEMAVEGYNCTAFCYGQTGSGKTHTLTGPPGTFEGPVDIYSENHGLVFRSFMYLFKLLQERRDFQFVLKASFLEIYNEKVIDLLNGSSRKPLAIRWSKKSQGFFVENLFTVDCEELDDLLAVLEEGMKNRSVGRHNMNDYSSRSHTILTVHITSEQSVPEPGVFISKQGKINFVDLAGSEMTKKTLSEGKTLEEANNINKSLMVLGYCIASLSDSKKKTGHIPYRDSKLTKLLADSLAGNGVTLMIACISPARSNINETLNTLRYAARAKNITTKPIVVMDPREALILSLKREVTALQNENDHLRSLLNLSHEPLQTPKSGKTPNEIISSGTNIITSSPGVDLEKLAELEGQELVELIKHYITENTALRKENAELFSTRDILIRDQEMVCRENERLLKKLEDVNSVCCRSPIIPARPTFSADMFNGDLDGTNGSFTSYSKNEGQHKIPDSITKEMNKRQIGKSVGEPKTQRRQNYMENRNISSTGSDGSTSSSDKKPIKAKYSPDTLENDSLAQNKNSWTQPSDFSKSHNNFFHDPSNNFNYSNKFFEDDDDDVKSPSFSRSSRESGRNSSATTLPLDENSPKVHHVFGSTVSLRDVD